KSKPGVFDSLVQVIDRLGLQSTLQDSSITLFALTNQIFQLAITNWNNIRQLADRPSEFLSNIKKDHLDTMITQFILRGKYASDSLTTQDGKRLFGVKHGCPMQPKLLRSTSAWYPEGDTEIINSRDTKRSQFERDCISTTTSSIN